MEFEDKIKIFSSKINEKLEHIETEETTKTALILPFLKEVMGYDTTDPSEVKAEYTADIGAKKGEKIDLAILNSGSEIMLIECKTLGITLDKKHISQLYRYFNITDSELGILTNGLIYQFYTDSIKPGKMDKSPFLEINLLDLSEKDIIELKKFSKEQFDISKIKTRVDNLKYAHDIHQILSTEIDSPSDDLVRLFTKQVYDGTVTANVKNKFYKIIKNEFKEVIDEKVESRLNEALGRTNSELPLEVDDDEIITTPEEFEGYYIVKSIVSRIVDPDRIFIRDTKSYCSVLLDDNNHYPIIRLYFNNPRNLKIGLFDDFEKYNSGGRKTSMYPLKNLKELYGYEENMLKTVEVHLKEIKQKKRAKKNKK
ncbi:type I restriction enzyme HsdR N-terminal domain-containing protein [uncultured Methanobrevibacter sp.]|uniref:type I restriction enzyme HsdR N-terminal domain-containing protein n=1 Tax=uncultured Methanobrevibacter sp. TaxID=253161 RepID=UPI0025F029B6|nr:type I restriction enzyme HsdR N-terminal domain-containing protein [uncultured Methanobrevibacter sp.]